MPGDAAPLAVAPLSALVAELFTGLLSPPAPASDPPAPPVACPDKLPACPADPADPPPTDNGVDTPPALPAGRPAPPPPPPPEDPFVVAPLFYHHQWFEYYLLHHRHRHILTE